MGLEVVGCWYRTLLLERRYIAIVHEHDSYFLNFHDSPDVPQTHSNDLNYELEILIRVVILMIVNVIIIHIKV